MKKFLSCTLIAMCAASSFAQVRIRSNNTMAIGEYPIDWESIPVENRDTVTTISLYGPNGDFRAGAHISFGDNSSIWGRNVQIGEMGNDSFGNFTSRITNEC